MRRLSAPFAAPFAAQPVGRPRGSYGELAVALRTAAANGPAPVRELCQRAQVGYAAGRYTASRLLATGGLVPVEQGRPMVLGLPPEGDELAGHLDALHRSFWPAADDHDAGACDADASAPYLRPLILNFE